jgi:hypothetical protein
MGSDFGPTTGAETVGPGQQVVFDREFNHERWNSIHNTQLDLDVQDPDGPTPGMAAVRRTIFGFEVGYWEPVDGRKHILVGELDNYSFYNPGTSLNPLDPSISTDEADFNFMMYPDPPFRFLLDDVVARMSAGERDELHERRRGPGFCVEGEITPDEEYYNNFWFRTERPYTSQLVGTTMGMYGLWVRDWGHGGRPEIHPSEVIWWRTGSFDNTGPHPFVRWTIIVLQDDSNRFDRDEDYDAPVTRPWSKWPRRAQITMSLQVPRFGHSDYVISIQDGQRIFEFPGEDVRSVSRDFDGRQVLTVSKRMSRPRQVKVRLSELSADPTNRNKLRCFLWFEVQVGEGDRGQEGFAELNVEHWVPPDPRPDIGDDAAAGIGQRIEAVMRPSRR